MPQIQYPAYSQPPAFTPPTDAQKGWHPSVPDVVRYESKGRPRQDAYQPHEQTTGATVFAVEQWALPKPLKAEAYVPTNPQQLLRPKSYATYPTMAYDFNPEDWALPKPLAAAAEIPDDPRLGRRAVSFAYYPYLFQTNIFPNTVVFPWGRGIDQTKQAKPLVATMPFLFRGESVQNFPAVLQWGAELPDDPRLGRRPLTFATYQSNFLTEQAIAVVVQPTCLYPNTTQRPQLSIANTVEFQYDFGVVVNVPTQSWVGVYPDTAPGRPGLAISNIPHLFRGESVENFAATLQWGVELPDDPRMGRRSVTFAAYPSLFRGETIESAPLVPLSWSPSYPATINRVPPSVALQPYLAYADRNIAVSAVMPMGSYPDTTRRASLSPPLYPSLFRGEAIENFAAVLQWGCKLPDDPRLGRRPVTFAAYPHTFRGEAPEQFAATLLWSAVYPNTTSRAALNTAEIPSLFQTNIFPTVSIIPCVVAPDQTRQARLPVAHIPYLFRGESVEQFAVPPLSWQGHQPAYIPTLRPQTRIDGLSLVQVVAAAASPTDWITTYPDTTRRLVLPIADIPSSAFRGQSVEPTLLWSVTYPDTTRRLVLPVSLIPTLFRGEAVEQFRQPLGAAFFGPDTTRRVTLHHSVWEHAWSYTDRTPAAVPLSWSPVYPNTTRRLSLPVSDIPYLFRGEGIVTGLRLVKVTNDGVTFTDIIGSAVSFPGVTGDTVQESE